MKMLLVDDHAVFRRGLKALLSDALPQAEVLEAADFAQGRERLQQAKVDLVLLDISLGSQSGLELLEETHRLYPKTRVLMLSAHPEQEFALRCLRLGAMGFVSKGTSADEVLAAVKKVLMGGRYVTTALAERLATVVGKDLNAPHDGLSSRELQVLCLVAKGESLKTIADALHLSEKTISTYRCRISAKLGISTNVELTRYAMSHKLVE